jgi:hypothetical protein
MAEDIAAGIRNIVLAITLVSFLLVVGLFLFFSARMVTQQTDRQLQTMPELVMKSQLDAFYKQNYSSMRTAMDALLDNGLDNGIAYMGMTGSNGRMHTSGVASGLDEEATAVIEDEYLTSLDQNLIIEEYDTYQLSDGTTITEVVMPVRRSPDDQTYGAIKIGFLRSSFAGGWSGLRNRVLITSVLFIMFLVIIILIYSQRWQRKIQNLLDTKEATLKDNYEEKIEEIKEDSSGGPLSPDEFFQIIDFSKKLTKSLDPADVLRYLVNSTVRILNVKKVVIFLLSPDDSSVLIGQMGMKEGDWMDRERLQEIEIEVGSGEIGTIAELGQTNILDKPSPGAGVAGALRSGGETIGVLRATEKKTGARMGNKDKLKVRLLCQISGEVIAHAFEYQEMRESLENGDSGTDDAN